MNLCASCRLIFVSKRLFSLLTLRTFADWSMNGTQLMKLVIKQIIIARAIPYISCINNYGPGMT